MRTKGNGENILQHSKDRARCRSCRYPQCVQCLRTETTLPHSSVAPKSLKELCEYRCESCRFPACRVCERAPKHKEKVSITLKRKQEEQNTWTCLDCTQSEMQFQDKQK